MATSQTGKWIFASVLLMGVIFLIAIAMKNNSDQQLDMQAANREAAAQAEKSNNMRLLQECLIEIPSTPLLPNAEQTAIEKCKLMYPTN